MNYIFDAAFAAFLIAAALQDVRRREITHGTVLCLVAIALAHMFYTRDYYVLFSLIPIGILIVIWYIKPDACGAADIKVMGSLLLYTGLSLFSLLSVMVACIFAASHMVFTKRSTTPFCYWLGLAGCGYMAARWFT
jgi:Flp pilus assembly protein protease CpaA